MIVYPSDQEANNAANPQGTKYLHRTERNAVPGALREHVCRHTATTIRLYFFAAIIFKSRVPIVTQVSYRITINLLVISRLKCEKSHHQLWLTNTTTVTYWSPWGALCMPISLNVQNENFLKESWTENKNGFSTCSRCCINKCRNCTTDWNTVALTAIYFCHFVGLHVL